MTTSDLKVGQFGKVNGSVIYRFRLEKTIFFPSTEGCLTIEKHPEKTLGWFDCKTCELIELPQVKHINNAIKQIKDTLKFKGMDNLTYIENYSILKNYLKPVIVKAED